MIGFKLKKVRSYNHHFFRTRAQTLGFMLNYTLPVPLPYDTVKKVQKPSYIFFTKGSTRPRAKDPRRSLDLVPYGPSKSLN